MSNGATVTPPAFVVRFRDLHRWSVGSFVETGWRWPTDTIKPLSIALSRKVVLFDRNSIESDALRLVTLHFDGEMELRNVSAADNFKGRLFHADPGDVIYSKIDVRNGAIGIIPENFGRVCVSSEYPVYSIDPKISKARYIKLLFRTDIFRRKLNSMISGASGRKRVQSADLETVKVPIPKLSVQHKIVETWEVARNAAAETDEKIEQLELDIEVRLLDAVDIHVATPSVGRRTLAVAWSDVERWDLFYHRPDFIVLERSLNAVSAVPLGEALKFISRGWRKADFPEGTFRYVEISNVTKEEGISGYRVVSVDDPPSRATTSIRKGEVILSMTRPYLGAFALVSAEYDRCVCSSGFALCTGPARPDVMLEYALEFLKSSAGLRQMERRMTGGLYPAITQDELEKVLLPIPPLPVQRQIVERISKQRSEIAKLKAEAKARACAAKVDVEAMILGTKKVGTP